MARFAAPGQVDEICDRHNRGFHGIALPGYADDRELVNEDGGGDDNGIADMDVAVEQAAAFRMPDNAHSICIEFGSNRSRLRSTVAT